MSLIRKSITIVVISLIATGFTSFLATVMGEPFTMFQKVTTINLTMIVCWFPSIAHSLEADSPPQP